MPKLSLFEAEPLACEPGLGALTIPSYLSEVCQRFGNNEAAVMPTEDGTERWSYADLWQKSEQVAKALIASGVGKETRVGLLMTNRLEFLSVLFGTAMAGGVFVPLSTFSTEEELAHLLSVSNVSILVFEDRVLKKDFSSMIAQLDPSLSQGTPGQLVSTRFPFLNRLVVLPGVTGEAAPVQNSLPTQSWQNFVAMGAEIDSAVVQARSQMVDPFDSAGLFFSSGTTSLPKGILHSQRAFAIQFWRWPRLWGSPAQSRCWTGNGFFWSGPVTIILGIALSTGGAVILQPLFDADLALALIESERVSTINGRPHQWARMQAAPGWQQADLSSLKQVTKGEIMTAHPSVNTQWDQPNAFGTTETMAILSSFEQGDPANQDPNNFGKLLPGNTIKIIDPLSHALVPMGEKGEICIKGPTLMKGYLGKTPEQCFDRDGFYCTGDGGYIDEQGHLFWQGRLNDIIKTGGANVSPQEVDTILAACPGVKRTQTLGIPHDTLSEIVVACIVPMDGASLKAKDIIAYAKTRLASYKVPREVLFFTEDEYPLTANEKVKVADLKPLAVERLGMC